MLKSAISAVTALCVFVVLALLALAFSEKPKPPPQRVVVSTTLPAEVKASAPEATPIKIESLPQAVEPENPEPAEPPTIEEDIARVLVLAPSATYIANSQDGETLAGWLEKAGIAVDRTDADLVAALDQAAKKAAARMGEFARANYDRFNAIADDMEAAGQGQDFTPDDRLERRTNGRRTIFTRTLPDGRARKYAFDPETHPEIFADRDDQAITVAEQLLRDAIAAVRGQP